jgi:hypothetical protein
VNAILSASVQGNIRHSVAGPVYQTLKALKRKGLVTMDEWSGNGMIGTPNKVTKAWDASLTGLGWQQHTKAFAWREYQYQLDPNDVAIIDGEPTIDGMPAKDWLKAMNMD